MPDIAPPGTEAFVGVFGGVKTTTYSPGSYKTQIVGKDTASVQRLVEIAYLVAANTVMKDGYPVLYAEKPSILRRWIRTCRSSKCTDTKTDAGAVRMFFRGWKSEAEAHASGMDMSTGKLARADELKAEMETAIALSDCRPFRMTITNRPPECD